MSTRSASDVHAALVFLDRNFALGAWFRVQLDPSVSHLTRTVFNLFVPLFLCRALNRLVCLFVTAEAERCSTLALDVYDLAEFAFKHFGAVFARTPFDLLI